jgi:hypothetical protein
MNIADFNTLDDARASCPHLSDREWNAIQGLGHVIGERQVLVVLGNNGPAEHQRIAFNFIAKENASLRDAERERREANEARPQRPKPLKLHVPLYKGGDSQNLPRWFVSIERAIFAQQITDEHLKVSFVISKLDAPARNWAEGCQLADENVFQSYEDLKERLMETFQPPKSEFRARAEFLDIRQDKLDIHAYVQVARDLISCIVKVLRVQKTTKTSRNGVSFWYRDN